MKDINQAKIKAEFVKCEFDHAWEAVKSFEGGESLYLKTEVTAYDDDECKYLHTQLEDFHQAVCQFKNIYRKVEREITWQDVVGPYGITDDCGDIKFDHMLDRGEFINVCHLIASMTDNKPE